MSDIISAIVDDMDCYVLLCQRLGEEVKYDARGDPDCYGLHAKKLARKNDQLQKFSRIREEDLETEVKIEIKNRWKVEEIYERIGKPRWNCQENFIYPSETGFLRLRQEDYKAFLTVKGKDQGTTLTQRPEIECVIPLDFFRTFVELNSDSKTPVYYKKLRASAEYQRTMVCLDNLNGRYFVEIEGTKRDVKENIVRLGLENNAIEKRNYLEIILQDGTA